MKKTIDLSPPIEHIERRLLGINEGLIQSVMRGETSAAIAAAVRAAPEWEQYQTIMAEAGKGTSLETGQPPPCLPEYLKQLIKRRSAAQALSSRKIPESGQIVRVEKIITPRARQLDGVLMAPLHVLLDAPAESQVLWHGWIAAGETEYASWWDFVLQEQDEPFDPEAGMIQLWNPVRLYLPMAGVVVGSLSPARMQAVRALAADFVAGDQHGDVRPWLGRVAVRTTRAGMKVTTGSPLGGVDDPRHRYQEIYFEAAEAVREPARLALREMAQVPTGLVGRFLGNLIAQAGRLAEVLVPEPRIAVAMSDKQTEEVPDLSWPDIARLRILDLREAGEGRIEVRSIGNTSLSVELWRNDTLLDKTIVAPGDADTVAWGADGTHLRLSTPSGRELHLALRDHG